MSTRLIIDGNAVYEIDEACEAGKRNAEKRTAAGCRQGAGRKQKEAAGSREKREKK